MAYEEKEEKAEGDKKVDEKDLLDECVKGLKSRVDAEAMERGKMLDDLRFATLDQWPSDVRKEREGDQENGSRPCLTIDQINQYIVQVVNDMRQGKPSIKVRPVDDQSDVETAKILQGLIRNIEDQSSADIAYMTAGESAAKIGLGYFRITNEYVSDDSFDQEIRLRPIPNTFSTYLGEHIMPDGSDAEDGYIVEQMPTDGFKKQYPKAKFDGVAFENLSDEISFWKTDETITVAERYKIKKEYEELLFLADGTTMPRADYEKWPEEGGPRPEIQDTRTNIKKKLCWYKFTGAEIIDQRELPGQYIPIVEVVGREAHVDGQRKLWGLVRPAKDSLRMYNYWASTITEKLALAPKTPYIGAVGQFATAVDRWKNMNRKNYPFVEYDAIDVNGNAIPAPRREQAAPIEVAMVQHLNLIKEDVKNSLGMYKSALGQSESQQSGRAILALQKESDTGTYHFGANLGVSIRHAGRIIIDQIPHYYDTKRIVRILGEDGEVQTVELDPEQETAKREVNTGDGIKNVYNPSVGKYDVTITVGPSYNTKRMEAAATFVELAKGATDPGSAAVMRYLSVKNADTAGSDEAAKMLKALLPPPVQQAMQSGNQAPIPPQVQAQMQKMGQRMQTMAVEGKKLQQENMQLKAGAATAQAKISAQREEKMASLQLEREVEMERAKLARERATEEIAAKRQAMHEQAAFDREKAVMDAQVKLEVAEISAKATLSAAQISAAAAGARPA